MVACESLADALLRLEALDRRLSVADVTPVVQQVEPSRDNELLLATPQPAACIDEKSESNQKRGEIGENNSKVLLPNLRTQESPTFAQRRSDLAAFPEHQVRFANDDGILHSLHGFAPSPRRCSASPYSGVRSASLPPERHIEELEENHATSDRICVAVRFRPLDERERRDNGEDKLCVRYGYDGRSCSITPGIGAREVDFSFEYVFQPEALQEDVYIAAGQPIVRGVIEGFNGAILAYGQTGSGKTHTMFGPGGANAFVGNGMQDLGESGIIPRALQELLDHVSGEGNVLLRASYVEIYQETVIDLLAPRNGGNVIREHTKTGMFLPYVTETPVDSVAEALAIMRTGNQNRHVAETQMNRHSSRSHAVFIVTVTNLTDGSKQKFAQLYLVDLAGSERADSTQVEGQQMKEAKNINTSLMSLGHVIWALAQKQKHVPYRNSKLTRLLRNCLGGNARTSIIIAASPHERNAKESLSALRFGSRASQVENRASANVASDPAELHRLLNAAHEELASLRGRCHRLESEVTMLRVADRMFHPENNSESNSSQTVSEPCAQRVLIWGLLPSLVCPLKRAIMRYPVCATDGWTYERSAIERHFAAAGRSLPTSPVTGLRMTSRNLVANNVVWQLIQQHLPFLSSAMAPPGTELPPLALLHVWQVQEILSWLDAKSLARCELCWSCFYVATEANQLWPKLLAVDFPAEFESHASDIQAGNEIVDAESNEPSLCSNARIARRRYSQLMNLRSVPVETKKIVPKQRVAGPSRGLMLFPQRHPLTPLGRK